jgi:hypothetical protein
MFINTIVATLNFSKNPALQYPHASCVMQLPVNGVPFNVHMVALILLAPLTIAELKHFTLTQPACDLQCFYE